MEGKNSSPNPFEFYKITEYLNKKSEKDEKFKEQLKNNKYITKKLQRIV